MPTLLSCAQLVPRGPIQEIERGSVPSVLLAPIRRVQVHRAVRSVPRIQLSLKRVPHTAVSLAILINIPWKELLLVHPLLRTTAPLVLILGMVVTAIRAVWRHTLRVVAIILAHHVRLESRL